MTPRIVRIFAAVLIGFGMVAVGIWVLAHSLQEHERMYQGKPITYWVDRLTNSDTTISNQANVVLDTVIIPQLTVQMFHDMNDSSFRMWLVDGLNHLPGLTVYFTPASGRRAGAAEGLGEFGPRAKAAIPDLVKAVKGGDTAVRGAAAIALGEIHSDPETVIPLLISCFDDSQEGVPESAVEAIGGYGSLAKGVVPRLVELLKVHDKGMRHAAGLSLRKIDPEAAAKAGLR